MMQQYQEIKSEHRDAILFFRLGDFYEMFANDAIEASKILDITLTARGKDANAIPMCGIPHHAAENYIAKLSKAGRKVAICEQISDPSLPGIVKRKVVRIITPGTSFSDQILQNKESHNILSIFPQKDYYGLAFADLSTGEFSATEIQGIDILKTEIIRIQPAELVIHRNHYEDPELRVMLGQLIEAPMSPCDFYEDSSQILKKHFKITTLEAFGIASWPFAIQAAGVLLNYLYETQKTELAHIDRIKSYNPKHGMPLDEATIRNLELFSTIRGQEEEGTLLSILDQTETPMGGRMLRSWLLRPLTKEEEIEARHDSVENLKNDDDLRNPLCEDLQSLNDLERLLGRLSTGGGNARDLLALGHSLALVPRLKTRLNRAEARRLKTMQTQLIQLDSLVDLIQKAILDEPAVKLTEGSIIKTGYHAELDEYHVLIQDAKTALRKIEEQEKAATGISSLKVRYNKVFGYYIEVSKSNLDKVPDNYIRKQTLVNAERYVTPELKEYEEKVLSAQEKTKSLEFELFMDLKARALEELKSIKQNAALIAELDVFISYAKVAIQRNYCRPQITRAELGHGTNLQIENGRHPVVESINFEQSFIPNDARFARDETELMLITGPNMSGKSTYLRQIALIALMNQIGSFIPADSAELPIFDRIFTRVGASDNLVKGQSTFMVEMQESAYIMHHATDRSLIILDEVGRGTSTYDGLSIAWSILEYLHDQVRAFTLFATHYHELIGLAEKLDHARNFCIDVQETDKGVLFLHKIKQGGIDQSYGIEVARLAGLPAKIIDRADKILHELENKEQTITKVPESQMGLFQRSQMSLRQAESTQHPAIKRLQGLDINNLTPIDALKTLDELKNIQ